MTTGHTTQSFLCVVEDFTVGSRGRVEAQRKGQTSRTFGFAGEVNQANLKAANDAFGEFANAKKGRLSLNTTS
jgi:hypothetical protein